MATLEELDAEEVLRIGSADDPEEGFTTIRGVSVASDGTIYAFDASDRGIRVFGSGGDFQSVFGGSGPGPGEFRSVPWIGIVGDTLWAIETRVRRLTLFDRTTGRPLAAHQFDGEPVPLQPVDRFPGLPQPRNWVILAEAGVRPRQRGPSAGLVVPRWMREDGRFVGELIETAPMELPGTVAETDTVRVPRLLFDVTGRVVDTAGWHIRPPPETAELRTVEADGHTYVVPGPPFDDPLSVLLPDGEVSVERRAPGPGASAVFGVLRRDLDGSLRYEVHFHDAPVPYSEQLLDTLAARAAWRAGGVPTVASAEVGVDGRSWRYQGGQMSAAGYNAARSRIRSAMELPAFQPPVQDVRVEPDGGIWLRREENLADSYRWILLDPDGNPRGVLTWPHSRRLVWSAGETVWAVETDELDVEWLVRYRIH